MGFSCRCPTFIEALSLANQKLLIGHTNSNCFMRAGHRVTAEDYLKRRRAFNKKYGV